jgi:hypothetical protein
VSGSLVRGTLGRLRHPWLFALAGAMLVADLLVPDALPFVDEVLLFAATAGLGLLRKRRSAAKGEEAPAEPREEP